MKVGVGAASHVGRVRERNEDSYLAEGPLFAVADGLGGHQGGEVASRVALDTLQEASRADGAEERIGDRLREGVVLANRSVHQRAAQDPALKGMGTTLTALVAGTGRFHLAHVGDSRAYLLRDGELTPLTEDHTLVRRLVREGRLTMEEAEIHPQRSILTRALGIEDDVEVDQATVEIQPGDRILLCSDGLTSMIPDREVHHILAAGDDPQSTAEALVAAANEAGGQDNITVVVVDVEEAEEPPAAIPARPDSPPVRATGDPAPAPAPPRRRRRLLVWAVVVVLVLAVAAVGGKAYLDRQWFVGVSDGLVALYKGAPLELFGIDLFSLVEETRLSSARASALQPWSDLESGITAGSEREARQIIAQIERDLSSPAPSPGPSPATPSPSP